MPSNLGKLPRLLEELSMRVCNIPFESNDSARIENYYQHIGFLDRICMSAFDFDDEISSFEMLEAAEDAVTATKNISESYGLDLKKHGVELLLRRIQKITAESDSLFSQCGKEVHHV